MNVFESDFCWIGRQKNKCFLEKNANFGHSVLHAVQLMRYKVESWIEVFEPSNWAPKFKLFKDFPFYSRWWSWNWRLSSFLLAVLWIFRKHFIRGIFWFDLFLEARAEILTKFSLVFWSILRQQKDISKLTDLYIEVDFGVLKFTLFQFSYLYQNLKGKNLDSWFLNVLWNTLWSG